LCASGQRSSKLFACTPYMCWKTVVPVQLREPNLYIRKMLQERLNLDILWELRDDARNNK